MLALLSVDALSYRTPDGRTLFQDLTFALERGRTGVVGPNGCGKSTLLRVIMGEVPPTSGVVTTRGRIGMLRQDFAAPAAARVAALLGVEEALLRLARIDEGAASEPDLECADWSLPERVDRALADVGLAGLDPMGGAAELSGGQATRAHIARLLIASPEIVLLDEPTNNLDEDARNLVGEVVERWRGAALVVSHDRALLRRMDRILDIGGAEARAYGGGYDLYVARRAEERAAAVRDLETAAREARRVDREIQATRERQDRRDAAGLRAKARRDQPKIVLNAKGGRAENTRGGQERLAERRRGEARDALLDAQARVDGSRTLSFALRSTGLADAKTVLSFDRVRFGWPGQAPLIDDLSFRLVGSARLAVCGDNGAGKTTVLRLALGELRPTGGDVIRGAPAAALDQRAALLDDSQTLLDNFRRLNPAASDNTARAALARFLFRNSAALARAGALSGGERLRAALACVLMGDRPPPLIVLDEPTNHLDLDSIAAVESALVAFDGALLIVSHDRDFLDAVGVQDRVLLSRSAPRDVRGQARPVVRD